MNSNDKSKLRLLNKIDVLVDGRFDASKKEGAPKYAGSSNQRIVNIS